MIISIAYTYNLNVHVLIKQKIKKKNKRKNLRSSFSKPPYKNVVLFKVISVQTHLKYLISIELLCNNILCNIKAEHRS